MPQQNDSIIERCGAVELTPTFPRENLKKSNPQSEVF
jgi:hypothetical protein